MNLPIRPALAPGQGIDIAQTSATTCDACGKEAFQEAVVLRKISALLSPTGKEGFIQVPVFACVACGHINNDFLPKELRKSGIIT
jgi:uncharacterized Zn finger protein